METVSRPHGTYRGLKLGNTPIVQSLDRDTRIENAKIDVERLLNRIINPRVPAKQKLKAQKRLLAMGIDLTKTQEGQSNEQSNNGTN